MIGMKSVLGLKRLAGGNRVNQFLKISNVPGFAINHNCGVPTVAFFYPVNPNVAAFIVFRQFAIAIVYRMADTSEVGNPVVRNITIDVIYCIWI